MATLVTVTPSTAPPIPAAAESLSQRMRLALLQDADLGQGWESYPGEKPGKQPSARPDCEKVSRSLYAPAGGAILSQVGWSSTVGSRMASVKQVVRGYPTTAAAAAFVVGLETSLGSCQKWKEGASTATASR